VSERRAEPRIGFLSFGHWQRAQWSRTLTAKDALVQTVELAQAAEEIGIDGAFVRVHHFARQLGSPFPLLAAMGARTSRIELGSYQAAKFAVDGLTRVLAAETAPLGIRYLVVEPGGFATDWAGASMEIQDIPDEYQATVGQFASHVSSGRTSAGDPKRAAEIIVRAIKHAQLPGHLLLGAGAARMAIDYSGRQLDEATAWQEVSASADFDAPHPVELPAPR
jgi:NAD(P)-dependent dehydrogenase (short-subunit alcohol dehydrogenase family)